MKLKVLALASGLALLALSSTGAFALDCGANTGEAASGEPIVVGAITGQTGPDNFSSATKAAKAYFPCVNANGGINGRPIDYRVEDDQWNPELAAQLGAKLVNDQQAVVLAASSSFVECGANAGLYSSTGITAVAGVGGPRECFFAKSIVPTKNLVISIVGDLAKIRPELDKLELGDAAMFDLYGAPIDVLRVRERIIDPADPRPKPWGCYEFAVSDPDGVLVRVGRVLG